jgi:general nucleoside transport system ATP-binding protein
LHRIRELELQGISKSFHDVQANREVSFSIRAGEIVGLLGENGAGKTTLMNVLYGLYQPDAGLILVNGEPVAIRSPRDAVRAGIGMVHQHFMLVDNHSVLENLALGHEGAPFFAPGPWMARKLEELGRRFGLTVNGEERIWQLSAGQQQRVEIVKALLRGADLLILDEPTSVLTPQEAEELFRILRRMASEGHSVILISHKLDEVLSICDRVVVLRRGAVVGSAAAADTDSRSLARMMVGRDVLFTCERAEIAPGEVVLEVADLTVRGDRGQLALRGASFAVRRSEIVGIAGVSGNGQRELAEAITGLRPVAEGSVRLAGADITGSSARRISVAGIGSVPEERMRFGVVPSLVVYENSVLKHQRNRAFSRHALLDFASIRDHARGIVEAFGVQTPSLKEPLRNLSGGNIQKLIVGRELAAEPRLLVAAHPTYGLDVGATEYIREQLLAQRERGVAILLISEDLEEIFALSDRIVVLYQGRVAGALARSEATVEAVGLLMTGSAGAASA